MSNGLTAKQAMFVQEYLVDLNATRAAVRAGYSPNGAASRGSRLLKREPVKRAIQEAMDRRSERTLLSQDWVINSLRKVAERCMQARPVLDREGAETGEYVFDARGANRALELLGKHLGMFTKKHQISGSGPVTVRINFIDGGNNNEQRAGD